jgi:ADP-ribosylglycohydrolase
LDVINGTKRDVGQNKSWIIHALYCAIIGLLYFRNNENRVKDVIDYVISLGGDTYTNARIAACLFGAEEGAAKIRMFDVNNYNLNILYGANPSLAVIPAHSIGLAQLTIPY